MNAMAVVDDDRRFIDVNLAACELFGRTRDELRTLRLDDAAVPGEFDTMWGEAMAAGSFSVDRQILRPDGSHVLVRVIATTNVEPGRHFATYLPIPMRLGAAAFTYSPGTSTRATRAAERRASERRASERRRGDRRTSGAPRAHLSPREREILTLLAQGGTGEGIAHSLGLSAETIRTHVRNAMEKLEVRTRSHAIAVAIRSGEIDPL
jgi:DNA-binding CsgD family transcriptional regulator